MANEDLEGLRSSLNSAYSNEFTNDQLKYLNKLKQGKSVKERAYKNSKASDTRTDKFFNGVDNGITGMHNGLNNAAAGLGALRNSTESLVGASDYQFAKGAFEADIKRNKGQFTMKVGAENGYGFGMKGSMSSSRAANAASLVAHGPGVAAEGLLNSVGIMTRQQKLAFKSGNIATKLGVATVPLLGAGILMSSMINGEDPADIASMAVTSAGIMTGLHVGLRGGAALTAPGTAARAAGLVLGGTTGLLAGLAVAGAGVYAARDLTSSQSSIAEFARKRSKREELTSISQNNATLTMRQRALQQVSSAEMNGRGSVLGSEAHMLKFGQ